MKNSSFVLREKRHSPLPYSKLEFFFEAQFSVPVLAVSFIFCRFFIVLFAEITTSLLIIADWSATSVLLDHKDKYGGAK